MHQIIKISPPITKFEVSKFSNSLLHKTHNEPVISPNYTSTIMTQYEYKSATACSLGYHFIPCLDQYRFSYKEFNSDLL